MSELLDKMIEASDNTKLESCILWVYDDAFVDGYGSRIMNEEAKALAEEAAAELADLTRRLEAAESLVTKWRIGAMDSVPPEYASRNLHRKYLKEDNQAAGMGDCADELAAALELESK